jgi:hypothetical protein
VWRAPFRRRLATRVAAMSGGWLGWLGVAAVVLVFAAAMSQWGSVVFQVVMVLFAAINCAIIGFWIAAEWTNVDDREMVGDPLPIVAVTTSTVLGALVVGGAVLLGTLLWA